jgi:hypothetical protein
MRCYLKDEVRSTNFTCICIHTSLFIFFFPNSHQPPSQTHHLPIVALSTTTKSEPNQTLCEHENREKPVSMQNKIQKFFHLISLQIESLNRASLSCRQSYFVNLIAIQAFHDPVCKNHFRSMVFSRLPFVYNCIILGTWGETEIYFVLIRVIIERVYIDIVHC